MRGAPYAPRKKAAARHLVLAKRYPQRRVCRLVGLSRSSARYEPRSDKDEEKHLVERLKKFARNPRKRRRGYRLAHKDIEREWKKRGKALNHKRVHRLWRQEGLSVPPRRHRKRLRSGKPATERVATAPDSIWCFDFVEVKSVRGQKLRIFCVSSAISRRAIADEFTRESLAIEVGTSFRSDRVCATLEKLMRQRGIPGAFRMDNGPEFIALALRGLCHRTGIEAGYIDPGKPWQNGFAESFHSRLRDEYLDGEVFWGVKDAQVGLDGYRRYFNEERLHSSLGYQTPLEFATQNAALKASGERGGFSAGSPVAKAA